MLLVAMPGASSVLATSSDALCSEGLPRRWLSDLIVSGSQEPCFEIDLDKHSKEIVLSAQHHSKLLLARSRCSSFEESLAGFRILPPRRVPALRVHLGTAPNERVASM